MAIGVALMDITNSDLLSHTEFYLQLPYGRMVRWVAKSRMRVELPEESQLLDSAARQIGTVQRDPGRIPFVAKKAIAFATNDMVPIAAFFTVRLTVLGPDRVRRLGLIVGSSQLRVLDADGHRIGSAVNYSEPGGLLEVSFYGEDTPSETANKRLISLGQQTPIAAISGPHKNKLESLALPPDCTIRAPDGSFVAATEPADDRAGTRRVRVNVERGLAEPLCTLVFGFACSLAYHRHWLIIPLPAPPG